MEEDPRSSGIVAVTIKDEKTEDSVPSSTTVVEAVENIKDYCIRIEPFLTQTLEQSPKADAEVSAFFRVPPDMRERGKGELLYDPKHINFSQIKSMLLTPRHHDDEERKLLSHYYRHLQPFLEANNKSLADCMEMMNKLNRKEILKRCYPELDNQQESVSSIDYPYLLSLLLSGCFIIDLLRRWEYDQLSPAYDQECGGIWASELWVDLLLVENQIPFFMLQLIQETMPLFRFAGDYLYKVDALEELICTYYKDFLPLKKPMKVNQTTEQFHHLLDFVHQCLLPEVKEERHRCCSYYGTLAGGVFLVFLCLPLAFIWKYLGYLWDQTEHHMDCFRGCLTDCVQQCAPKFLERFHTILGRHHRTPAVLTTAVPTARRLQEAGVQFKSVEMKGFVVEFKKGVLWLPRLHVRSNTYKCFMNLIAWEHCYPKAGKYFTNFVIFMDYLINNSKDVEILIHSGVLEHSLSTDEKVVELFNNLGKDLVYTYDEKYDFLTKLSRELKYYCENKFNIWRANLLNEYFKSPWSIISVLAA